MGNAASSSTEQAADRQPADVPAQSDDSAFIKKRFAELEAAEKLSAERNGQEGPLQKRRRQEEAASVPACPTSPQSVETALQHAGPTSNLPPPEKVIQAFDVLDLPVTRVLREVERKCRRLSFRHHPDKVNPQRRWQAAQEFRKIQNARTVIVTWLREGKEGDDSEVSDDPQWCRGSGEESDGVDGDAGGAESGSVSDEREDEFLACGVRPRGMSCSRSPSEQRSDEEDDDTNFRSELAVQRGSVCSESQYAVGVSAQGSLGSLRSQLRAIQSNGQDPMCSECFDAKPVKGKTMCEKCCKDLKHLMRRLEA